MKIASNGLSKSLLFLLLVAAFSTLQAGGLSTQLGEVMIENLQVGQTYNLNQLANLHLIVTNNSITDVNLRMDVLLPDNSELKNGALPVPDTSWIKLSCNKFVVGPQEQATSDISIIIPDDIRFMEKKYQVTIWSHTLGVAGNGMMLAYGLKSRIIFTTTATKSNANEVIRSSDASVDLTLKPEEIYLNNVVTGAIYDLDNNKSIVLNITNSGDHERTYHLQSLTVGNSVATLTQGYEDAPDASYLKFSESEFVLAPGATKLVKMYLQFPAKKEFRGKRYMFVVHAYSPGAQVSTGVYSRVYAATIL